MPTTIRKITEEDVRSIPSNPADTIPLGYRLELHRRTEELHLEHQDESADPGSIHLHVSGPRGSGKSNCVCAIARRYYESGFTVISNMSLMFGWTLESAVELMTFAHGMPQRMILIVDEVHALMSRYRQSSTGQLEFMQGISGLRKARVSLLTASSQETELAANYLSQCQWLIYPSKPRIRPGRFQRRGEHYPMWCASIWRRYGPYPAAGGLTVEEKLLGSRRSNKSKVKKYTRRPPPQEIYEAAALQSSFAPLPKGKAVGTHVGAKDVREALRGDSGVTTLILDDPVEVEEEQDDDTQGISAEERASARDADEKAITDLYIGLRNLGLHQEKRLPLATLKTRLNLHDGDAVEDLLERWVGRRPGQRYVDTTMITKLFGQ